MSEYLDTLIYNLNVFNEFLKKFKNKSDNDLFLIKTESGLKILENLDITLHNEVWIKFANDDVRSRLSVNVFNTLSVLHYTRR